MLQAKEYCLVPLYQEKEAMKYYETTLYSLVKAKCPSCHEGNFFETQNPYNLRKFDKMHHKCPVCGEDFERETGFYYGAMYVSYGLTVGFGITVYAIMCGLFDFSEVTFLITFALLQLLLMPVFYRLARLVWINTFVHYNKERKTRIL
jgi:uncharacterized protein (DUF983 family)